MEDKNKQIKTKKIFIIGSIFIALIAAILSFYFLILPAITMVAEPICGDENHLHTKECFKEEVELSYVCGKEEHVHDESCYNENGELVCLREEHVHTGKCIQALIIKENKDIAEDIVHGDVDTTQITLPQTQEDENSANLLSESKVANNGPIDFSGFITNISFQVANDGKNFVDYDPQMPLYSYQQLRFSLDYEIPAYTLTKTNKTISYQIPYNIKVDSEHEGKVFNKSGKAIGDYTINESGIITIVFYENFAEKNENGEIIYGNVMFSSEVSSFDSKKDGSVEFIFSDNVRVDIKITDKTDKSGDLYIEKTQSQLLEDKTIDYNIKVYSKEGTGDVVKISDTMSNVLFYNNLVVTDQNGNRIDIKQPNENDKTFACQLPKLEKGGYYILTYKAKLSEDFSSSTYLNNQVTATSKDSDGMEIEATTAVSLYYSVNIISKTGNVIDDNTIEWTIEINKDHMNIGGYTLQDTFNNVSYEKEVELTGPTGTQKVKLPYTFKENDTNSYTVKYRTSKEKIFGGNSAYNKVELKKGDKTYSSEKYIYLGESENNVIEKTAKDINVDDNGNVLLTWHLHIEFSDPLQAGKEISDFASENHYFTAEQVRTFLSEIDKLKIPYTYKLYGPGGWWPEYESIDESAHYGSIRIKFDKPVKSGTILDFDYTTTAHIDDLNKEQNYSNSFSVDTKTTQTTNLYEPTIKKYDPASSENPSRHTLTEDGLINWVIRFTVPEHKFDLREELPDGVSLNSITLHEKELDYEEKNNGIVIHFGEEFAQENKGTVQFINVSVKIDKDYKWKKHSALISEGQFTNKIYLEQNRKTVAQSEHTQIIEKKKNEEDVRVIEKTYNGVNSTDSLPYTLDINKNAKDFKQAGDTLNIVDKMSYYGNSDEMLLYLAQDSVEAFEVLEDGTTRKLTDEEFSFKYSYDISNAASKWGNCTNTLEMKIPDQMHIRVTYIYKVNGKKSPNTWYSFTNSATVTDTDQDTESSYTQTSISISKSETSAYTEGLEIYKVDSTTGQPLSGVFFRLYKYNGTDYELVTFDNDEDLLQTNEEGIIELKNIKLNTAYYLDEVLPKDNYTKIEPYYFMIHDDDEETYPVSKPSSFQGDIYRRGMNITIQNTKPTTSVNVKKVWTDGNGIIDGITGESAQINLYQIAQSDDDFNNGITTSGTVTLTTKYSPNEWNTFDNLTETNEYLAGTKFRLTLKYHNQWYAPDIIVRLGNETLGGEKKGVYIEKHHEYWTENVLQYTEYVYEFTLNSKSELNVIINSSSTDDWEYNLEAIEIPASGVNSNLPPTAYKTIILNSMNNWEYTWEDLPLIGTDQDGNTVHYSYIIKEVNVSGYKTEIQLVNSTENSYEYIVTNKRTTPVNYNMPATGGIGVYPFYIIGTLILLFAIYKIIKILQKKH